MSMGSRNSTVSKGSHNSIYERNSSNMTVTTTQQPLKSNTTHEITISDKQEIKDKEDNGKGEKSLSS